MPTRSGCWRRWRNIELERVPVDLQKGEHKQPAFSRLIHLGRYAVLKMAPVIAIAGNPGLPAGLYGGLGLVAAHAEGQAEIMAVAVLCRPPAAGAYPPPRPAMK